MALALTLRIRLLGDFSLTYRNETITSLHAARLHSLLAYLVLHRDAPQLRQHLSYIFWPDSTETQARNNLRQMVHQIRLALPDADTFLHADTNTLQWQAGAPYDLDVADFEHALALASTAEREHNDHTVRAALEQALDVYQGDLLPGCYDDWIVPERARLRLLYMQALARLVRLLEAQRDYPTAIRYAQRWSQADQLNEDACHSLMRLLAVSGDRASALRVYHVYETALRQELGVSPGQAVQEIHERLVSATSRFTSPAEMHPPPTSLIGRREEWQQLQRAWDRACAGRPGFVLIAGEAGIGKSRLAEELLIWATEQGFTVARSRSYAAEGQLSLSPVTEWLRSASFRPHLTHLSDIWRVEVARILPELLAGRNGLPHYSSTSDYGRRQRFFEALARAVFAAPQPVLLIIDDMQWCDPETLQWLHFLLRFDTTARLLVVGTVRREEVGPRHPLHTLLLYARDTADVTEIALQPLDAAETSNLAAQIAAQRLDIEDVMRLYHETEGNPLFIIEMIRAGFGLSEAEEGVSGDTESAPAFNHSRLPPRVQAVIMGRLTKLSPAARDVASLAAAIGREFMLDVLVHAGNAREDDIIQALDELWQKRIVRGQEAKVYDFTHDKLREVAYAEISAPQRRLLHHRIAQAIEQINVDNPDPVSAQIASHYDRAGMIQQAIPHYQRAAAVAQHMYANEDAINLLNRALTLLEQLPASARRDGQELILRLALAPLVRITKGWAAPELESVLGRALTLCDTVGDDMQRAQILYGLQSLHVVQAKLDEAQRDSDELQAIYQRTMNTESPLLAGVIVAGARLHLGRFAEASDIFERIIADHDPAQLQHLQEFQGVNYAVHALAWQAHALWGLGYPQRAMSRALEAVQAVREPASPFNQALVATYLAMLHQLNADPQATRTHAKEALRLTKEYRAHYYYSWAVILASYAEARDDPTEASIAHLREAIVAFKSSSARLRLPYYLSLLAHVWGEAGHPEEGLTVLDEALAEARVHTEYWWNAELYRLRGELLLAGGSEIHDAEAALVRANEIAREQRAKALELRAATSLAKLRVRQRREAEAQQLLSAIVSWFTEGFDTPDFREARTLLTRLQ